MIRGTAIGHEFRDILPVNITIPLTEKQHSGLLRLSIIPPKHSFYSG